MKVYCYCNGISEGFVRLGTSTGTWRPVLLDELLLPDCLSSSSDILVPTEVERGYVAQTYVKSTLQPM